MGCDRPDAVGTRSLAQRILSIQLFVFERARRALCQPRPLTRHSVFQPAARNEVPGSSARVYVMIFRHPLPRRLACAPAIEHGSRIPAQRGGGVATDAKPVDLEDAAAVQRRGNGISDDGNAQQGAAVIDPGMKAPGNGHPAMGMVLCDEPLGAVAGRSLLFREPNRE